MAQFEFNDTSKTLETSAGKLHYHVAGSDKLPSLLVLHGSGPGVTGWANFSENLDLFSQNFHCLILDLPGYGLSDSVTGNPVQVCVEAIGAFLEGLKIDKCSIIGNSLGGIVAGLFAAYNPDKVSKLVSIGGLGINIFSSFPAQGLTLLSEFSEDPTRERIVSWLSAMVYDQSLVTEELINSRFEQALEPKTLETTRQLYSKDAINAMADIFSGPDATQRLAHLSSIQAPTLLTWGRDDRVSPVDMALLPMRLIPNCELHVFPKCGHWAMIEQKEAFENVVNAFLNR